MPPDESPAERREADIDEVKTFVSMVGAANEEIQWKCLQAQAERVQELLEHLLPPKEDGK